MSLWNRRDEIRATRERKRCGEAIDGGDDRSGEANHLKRVVDRTESESLTSDEDMPPSGITLRTHFASRKRMACAYDTNIAVFK